MADHHLKNFPRAQVSSPKALSTNRKGLAETGIEHPERRPQAGPQQCTTYDYVLVLVAGRARHWVHYQTHSRVSKTWDFSLIPACFVRLLRTGRMRHLGSQQDHTTEIGKAWLSSGKDSHVSGHKGKATTPSPCTMAGFVKPDALKRTHPLCL